MTKKIEPDGWIKRGFLGAFDLRSLIYLDELMGNPEYKEYVPVCLVPPELISWIEEMRGALESGANCYEIDTEDCMEFLNDLNKIWPKKENE